jgi:hypothetical protein
VWRTQKFPSMWLDSLRLPKPSNVDEWLVEAVWLFLSQLHVFHVKSLALVAEGTLVGWEYVCSLLCIAPALLSDDPHPTTICHSRLTLYQHRSLCEVPLFHWLPKNQVLSVFRWVKDFPTGCIKTSITDMPYVFSLARIRFCSEDFGWASSH